MRFIRFMNESFLSDDPSEIHWAEYVWFYGFYIFIITVPFTTWLYIR